MEKVSVLGKRGGPDEVDDLEEEFLRKRQCTKPRQVFSSPKDVLEKMRKKYELEKPPVLRDGRAPKISIPNRPFKNILHCLQKEALHHWLVAHSQSPHNVDPVWSSLSALELESGIPFLQSAHVILATAFFMDLTDWEITSPHIFLPMFLSLLQAKRVTETEERLEGISFNMEEPINQCLRTFAQHVKLTIDDVFTEILSSDKSLWSKVQDLLALGVCPSFLYRLVSPGRPADSPQENKAKLLMFFRDVEEEKEEEKHLPEEDQEKREQKILGNLMNMKLWEEMREGVKTFLFE